MKQSVVNAITVIALLSLSGSGLAKSLKGGKDAGIALKLESSLTGPANFEVAAKGGDSTAQFNLAQMYRLGRIVKKDYPTAVKWYRLAAEQGDPLSQFNLGLMYYNTQGVPRDLVRSHMWLNISATAGTENAVRHRNIVAKQMSPEQLTAALSLARDCIRRLFKACEEQEVAVQRAPDSAPLAPASATLGNGS